MCRDQGEAQRDPLREPETAGLRGEVLRRRLHGRVSAKMGNHSRKVQKIGSLWVELI